MYEERFMREALRLASECASRGEVPVGAVIVKNGEIISFGCNNRENGKNALLHAEMTAIDVACKKTGTWRLSDCELYVTLEPCPMCAGAIINSRISNVYFGCSDSAGGAAGGKINLLAAEGFYNPVYEGGFLEEECSELLRRFFSDLRNENKNKRSKLMTVSMIAAKGNNNEIGADNALLWHISADLKYFKGVTMGKAVIMGRKTFESLPKALPGRKNIVITKNMEYHPEGAVAVSSPEEALRQADTNEVFIIGGESIYKAFIDKADKLYITEVDFSSDKADAFFPEIPYDEFESETVGGGCENGLNFKHIVYTRKDSEK